MVAAGNVKTFFDYEKVSWLCWIFLKFTDGEKKNLTFKFLR